MWHLVRIVAAIALMAITIGTANADTVPSFYFSGTDLVVNPGDPTSACSPGELQQCPNYVEGGFSGSGTSATSFDVSFYGPVPGFSCSSTPCTEVNLTVSIDFDFVDGLITGGGVSGTYEPCPGYNWCGPGWVVDMTGTIEFTPVPAALPLFATGVGAMGLFSWRRKRRARAITV